MKPKLKCRCWCCYVLFSCSATRWWFLLGLLVDLHNISVLLLYFFFYFFFSSLLLLLDHWAMTIFIVRGCRNIAPYFFYYTFEDSFLISLWMDPGSKVSVEGKDERKRRRTERTHFKIYFILVWISTFLDYFLTFFVFDIIIWILFLKLFSLTIRKAHELQLNIRLPHLPHLYSHYTHYHNIVRVGDKTKARFLSFPCLWLFVSLIVAMERYFYKWRSRKFLLTPTLSTLFTIKSPQR